MNSFDCLSPAKDGGGFWYGAIELENLNDFPPNFFSIFSNLAEQLSMFLIILYQF